MRCIGKGKFVLTCSIYLSISVCIFFAGSALYPRHVMPLERAATALVATRTSPENIETRINLPEVYQPNHTRYPEGSLAAAMAQCVEQVGLFSEREVGLMTTELQRRPNLRERWPLVFTHIPKTGGTTVAEGLKQAFRAQGCGVITPGPGKVSIRKGTRHCFGLEVLSGWRLYPWGIFAPEMLQSLPRQSIIGVEGHVPFGICRFFDHLNCSYATLLREPIERYVSHIRWECHLPPFDKPYCNSSIAEYTRAVMRGDIWFYGVDNHQTRMLSGDASEDSLGLPCFEPGTCQQIGFRKVGPTQLRTAIRNIVFHYPVLGLLEDLESFSNRLKRIYGYSIKFKHRNKATFHGMDLNLTAGTMKDLQSFLAPDLALYRFVKCILDAKGPRFGKHIEKASDKGPGLRTQNAGLVAEVNPPIRRTVALQQFGMFLKFIPQLKFLLMILPHKQKVICLSHFTSTSADNFFQYVFMLLVQQFGSMAPNTEESENQMQGPTRSTRTMKQPHRKLFSNNGTTSYKVQPRTLC